MKHIKLVQKLLDSEIGDYSYDSDIELYEEGEVYEIYSVKITNRYLESLIGYITLRTDGEKIEVELGEDNWEEIETFEWTIKYFWMALLTK